ncbi:hypothetical protein [Rubripirellula reticaptiva]|uniref:hypothetical protein n=1 Tax=Rubripirellula reticaptiva TaxID=2528013 RepID=UPI0011B4C8DC|nr:hypothetical protein [Rubripirellula reticaptiva]
MGTWQHRRWLGGRMNPGIAQPFATMIWAMVLVCVGLDVCVLLPLNRWSDPSIDRLLRLKGQAVP